MVEARRDRHAGGIHHADEVTDITNRLAAETACHLTCACSVDIADRYEPRSSELGINLGMQTSYMSNSHHPYSDWSFWHSSFVCHNIPRLWAGDVIQRQRVLRLD